MARDKRAESIYRLFSARAGDWEVGKMSKELTVYTFWGGGVGEGVGASRWWSDSRMSAKMLALGLLLEGVSLVHH